MKTNFLLIGILVFIASVAAKAQSSELTFFTEEGEKFTLFINGSQINNTPQTKVVATGITADYVKAKVVFSIPGAPVLNQTIMVEPATEMTAAIKKNKKGKYRFVPVSMTSKVGPGTTETVPVPVRPTTPPHIVNPPVYHETPPPAKPTVHPNPNSPDRQIFARVEGNNISLEDGRIFTIKHVNMNLYGSRVEMKNPVGAWVTISYDGVRAYSSDVPFLYEERDRRKGNMYFTLTVSEPRGVWSVKLQNSIGNLMVIDQHPAVGPTLPPYPAPSPTPAPAPQNPPVSQTGCTTPMAADKYQRALSSIESKSFSSERMTVFKQIANANCFSVNQVIGLMETFTFENDKIEVAKYAYHKTVDIGNYYEVNDALTYSSSIDELNKFIERQR